MAIRLNQQPINQFSIDGRNVNRIMLNSERIWPEGEIEDNNIKIQVPHLGNSDNNSYCFGSMRMWNDTYDEIMFNNIDRIGNPEGAANPHNFEAVISNDETICTIKHNLGAYYYNPIPTEWVLKKTNYDGAYAWLPNPIGIPLYQGQDSYIGYRCYLTSNNKLTIGETYDINVSSVGREVKYLMMEFANNTTSLSSMNHIPLKIMYRDKVVYEYATEAEFREGELLYVENTTYRKVYIFGTNGNVYIAWCKNRRAYPDLRDTLYICKREYFEGKIDLAHRKMEITTLEQIVKESNGKGFIDTVYPLVSEINISTERVISNNTASQKGHVISSILLYDENHNLILDENSAWDSDTVSLRYSNKDETYGAAYGHFDNNQYHIGTTCDHGFISKWYTGISSLGTETTQEGHGTQWKYVTAYSSDTYTTQTGDTVNWTFFSTKKIKLIAIPLFRSGNNVNTEWVTKLTLNNMEIGGYLSTEKTKMQSEQYKSVLGVSYVRRYFFDIINNVVYCSYVQAGMGANQHLHFRKIFVFARDTKRMHEIDINELLTGKYPDGEFDESNTWLGNYVFELGNPVYSSNINYVTLSGLKVVEKSGKVLNIKKTLTPAGHYNGSKLEDYTHSVILSNDEPFTITVNSGSYAGSGLTYYCVSDMIPRKYSIGSSGMTWSCWLSANNTEGPAYKHIVKFSIPSDDKIVIFCPWWYYISTRVYTSSTKLLYLNNNDQVLKDFVTEALDNGTITDPAIRTGAIWTYTRSRELKTVKGVSYVRCIMATVQKAYIIWIKDLDGYMNNTTNVNDVFKYNEEFDEMLDFTIEDIIDQDLVDESVPTPALPTVTEPINFKLAMKYNWNVNNYFGVGNGMIYTEDPDTQGFKLINHADLKNKLYKRTAGHSPDDTYNSMQRFVDSNDVVYEIKTNAGCYNNSDNYDLYNIFSTVKRPAGVNQYGHLSGFLPNGGYSDRLLNYTFSSTAKIKALCFQLFYTYGTNAIPGKFVYNDEVIYEFATHSEAHARLWNEGMFKRWIIFPDRKEIMCVRTPNNGYKAQTGVVHTPHYLWNRRTFQHDEISIDDLYNLDKDLVKYNRDDASYDPPIPEVNRLELKLAKTWDGPYNTETYMALGNCLMFDEEYNVINLTFKSVTRHPTTDDRNEGAYVTSIWSDPDGNEYVLETDAGIYSTTYKLEHTFTGIYTIPNTNYSVNEWLGYNNDLTTLDENGNVVKWREFNIIGRTKKIGAVAISSGARGKNGNSGYGYVVNWGFPSYIKYTYKEEDPNDNTNLIEKESNLFNYPTKEDYTSDIKFNMNSKVWYKRMVVLEDGRVFTTWLPYNFKF